MFVLFLKDSVGLAEKFQRLEAMLPLSRATRNDGKVMQNFGRQHRAF